MRATGVGHRLDVPVGVWAGLKSTCELNWRYVLATPHPLSLYLSSPHLPHCRGQQTPRANSGAQRAPGSGVGNAVPCVRVRVGRSAAKANRGIKRPAGALAQKRIWAMEEKRWGEVETQEHAEDQ